jgi:hydrogenase maturation protease
VAAAIRARDDPPEVMEMETSGLSLLDGVVGADTLVVVDAVRTGAAKPGTVHVIKEGDLAFAPGGSQHTIGLFEALDLGRALGLDVPTEVVLVAVEALDLETIGGPMSEAVAAAVPAVADVAAGLAGAP